MVIKVRKPSLQEEDQVTLPAADRAEAAINWLVLAGFLGTILHTLPYTLRGEVWYYLHYPDIWITEANLYWYVSINVYLSLLFYVISILTGKKSYAVIAIIYLFAVVELFLVWDKPWFTLLYVPITSNTLIFFTLLYIFAKQWRLT